MSPLTEAGCREGNLAPCCYWVAVRSDIKLLTEEGPRAKFTILPMLSVSKVFRETDAATNRRIFCSPNRPLLVPTTNKKEQCGKPSPGADKTPYIVLTIPGCIICCYNCIL